MDYSSDSLKDRVSFMGVWLEQSPEPTLRRAFCLIYCSTIAVLNSLIVEQGALHFHFALSLMLLYLTILAKKNLNILRAKVFHVTQAPSVHCALFLYFMDSTGEKELHQSQNCQSVGRSTYVANHRFQMNKTSFHSINEISKYSETTLTTLASEWGNATNG